jgi:hypothetical protein
MNRFGRAAARILGMFAAAWGLAGAGHATTLAPMSFDEQVREAAAIFRGRVTAVSARMRESPQGRAIISRVSFKRLAAYKGDVPAVVTLEFLGGKLGGEEMIVDGMPVFAVGEELILFVSGESNRACPVVGWTEGRLRVDRAELQGGKVRLTEKAAASRERTIGTRAAGDGTLALDEFEAFLRGKIQGAPDR